MVEAMGESIYCTVLATNSAQNVALFPHLLSIITPKLQRIGFSFPESSRCQSVLGIPAFWASPFPNPSRFGHPLLILLQRFGHPPGTLPGYPNRQCFGHPLQRNVGFRGKIGNVLEMASAKYRNLFQYLKKKAYPEGFTKQKNDSAKFAKKFEYDSKLESLFQVAKEKDGTALRRIVHRGRESEGLRRVPLCSFFWTRRPR